MDMCRIYGIRAVNAHAGGELIDNSLQNDMIYPTAAALAEVRRRIARLPQPATKPAAGSSPAATQPENVGKS